MNESFARLTRWGRLLAVNAAVLASILALGEGLTRVAGIRFSPIPGPGDTDRGLWIYDATKGWFHAPHSSGRAEIGGPDRAAIRINGLGLRGGEIEIAKPPGVFRILVFGDSFIFGVGVDEEHLFSTQLQREMRAAGGKHVEVVNMGVSGYSTDQELILFQELGSRLSPDLVIVGLCDNDFEGNSVDFTYKAYYKPYFEVAGGSLHRRNSPVPTLTTVQSAKLWLGRHSNLWNAARIRRSDSPAMNGILAFFQVAQARRITDDAVGLTHALFREFRADAERSGARFAFFNVGARDEKTATVDELRARLRADGFAVIALDGPLAEARAKRPRDAWDFGHDTHWNVAAHREAARIVFEGLRDIGVLRFARQ